MRNLRKKNNVYKLTSLSEEDTADLGKRMGNFIFPGICILFYGELGAGKTVFIRGICETLGIEKKVVRSPSFTLVNEYKGVFPVAHVDLYRLEGDKNAVNSLSLGEYTDKGFVLLVEWAENGNFDMDETLIIKIDTGNDDNIREFAFSATGERSETALVEFFRIEQV